MSLVLVDVSNLIYRAYYTLSPDRFKSSDGIVLNAVYGVCTMLLKLASDFKDSQLVCCFDSSSCNAARKKIDPQYKANRAKAPPELGPQFKLVRALIESMQLTMVEVEYMEADDIIASIVEAYHIQHKLIICSPDKDYSQLLDYPNTVQYDAKKKVYITAEDVVNKYGVQPKHFVLYQALIGDKCDNVPGCPQIGPKIATELVNLSNGDLDSILNSGHKKAALVQKHVESVKKSLTLVTLVKKEITLDLSSKNIFNESFKAFCEKYEFHSLLKKYFKISK